MSSRQQSVLDAPDISRSSAALTKLYKARALTIQGYIRRFFDPVQQFDALTRLQEAAAISPTFLFFLRDLVIVPPLHDQPDPHTADNHTKQKKQPTSIPSRSATAAPRTPAVGGGSSTPPPLQTMEAVCNSALTTLFTSTAVSRDQIKNNVLCVGFYVKHGAQDAVEVRPKSPNLAVRELSQNQEWARLLGILGPTTIQHMLVHCSIFHPFDNTKEMSKSVGRGQRMRVIVGRDSTNHVQLCGQRVDDVAWTARRTEPAGGIVDDTRPPSMRRPVTTKKSILVDGPLRSPSPPPTRSDDFGQDDIGPLKHKSRPPSWVRRREAKARQDPTQVMDVTPEPPSPRPRPPTYGSLTPQPTPMQVEHLPSAGSPAPTEPFHSQPLPDHDMDQIPVPPPQCKPPLPTATNTLGLSATLSALISRKDFMYSSTFNGKAGLTASHPLAAASTEDGALRLGKLVLGERLMSKDRAASTSAASAPPIASSASAFRNRGSTSLRPSLVLPPSAPLVVDSRLRPFLALLDECIRRAPLCPFRLLLTRLCPLPLGWLTSKQKRRKREQAAREMDTDDPPLLTQPMDLAAQDADAHMVMDNEDRAPPHRVQVRTAGAAAVNDWRLETSTDIAKLSQAVSPPHRVAAFVWACMERIVPSPLLGGERTREALRTAILIMLTRRRYEALSVGEVMELGVSTKEFYPVLLPRTIQGAHVKVQREQDLWVKRVVAAWVGWLMDAVAVELVRCHFSVTESEGHRHCLFYYRKPVFASLRLKALTLMETAAPGQAQANVLKRVTREELLASLSKRNWGVGRLRILPKKGGVRPIANMTGPVVVPVPKATKDAKPTTKTLRSYNKALAYAHEVLRLESSESKQALGLSVFDFQGLYKKLAPFYIQWRIARKHYVDLKPYILSADVSKAFDSLNQSHVMRTVTDTLCHANYNVRPFKEVSTGSTGQIRIPDRRWPSLDLPTSAVSLAQAITRSQGGRSGVVLADMASSSSMTQARATQDLELAVTATFLKAGGRWYQQTRGIPQGSVASSLLCSMALGAVENEHVIPVLTATKETLAAARQVSEQGGGSVPASSPGALTLLAEALTSSTSTRQPPALKPPSAPSQPPRPGVVDLSRSQISAAHRRRKGIPELPLSVGARLIDDFLYISSDQVIVECAFKSVVKALPGSGCGLNVLKTNLNFQLTMPGEANTIGPSEVVIPPQTDESTPKSKRPWFEMSKHVVWRGGDEDEEVADVPTSAPQRFVPYVGLLINSRSLEWQADYGRYVGEPLSTTITVNTSKKPGVALAGKLRLYLSHKCIALLLDPLFVTRESALLNCYQSFCMAAMKFHVYLTHLPMGLTSPGLITSLIRSAHKVFRAMAIARLERARTATSPAIPTDLQIHWNRLPKPEHYLKQDALRFLSAVAFRTVLGKKAARYPKVLSALDADLRGKHNRRVARRLQHIIDPRRSATLFHCKY